MLTKREVEQNKLECTLAAWCDPSRPKIPWRALAKEFDVPRNTLHRNAIKLVASRTGANLTNDIVLLALKQRDARVAEKELSQIRAAAEKEISLKRKADEEIEKKAKRRKKADDRVKKTIAGMEKMKPADRAYAKGRWARVGRNAKTRSARHQQARATARARESGKGDAALPYVPVPNAPLPKDDDLSEADE